MRRINLLITGLLLLVWFCASSWLLTAAPQAKSSATSPDAATLLARATAHLNIESPSSAPFVLLAKARYTVNKQTVEGTYALGWAARNLYREDFQYGESHDTILVSGDKLYRVGPDTPRANLWSQMIKRALQCPCPRELAQRSGLRASIGRAPRSSLASSTTAPASINASASIPSITSHSPTMSPALPANSPGPSLITLH